MIAQTIIGLLVWLEQFYAAQVLNGVCYLQTLAAVLETILEASQLVYSYGDDQVVCLDSYFSQHEGKTTFGYVLDCLTVDGVNIFVVG